MDLEMLLDIHDFLVKHKCPKCDGEGSLAMPWRHNCPDCGGKGYLKEPAEVNTPPDTPSK